MIANDPVVLILVDGMRPDALSRSDAPAIKGLLNKGGFTFTAQTVIPSVTRPCIISGSKLKSGQLVAPVSVLDIAPTVASLLGLSAPQEWMGKSLV